MDQRAPWKTLSTTTLLEEPPIEVRRDEVELPGGNRTGFDYVDAADAAVVFPITADGRVVTVREWRQAVRRVVVGLPGGSFPPEEDPETAARRELEEETGYVPENVERLHTVEVDNGLSSAEHHHFVGFGCEQSGNRNRGEYESIEVELKTVDELLEKSMNGEISDAKTLMGLFLYHFTSLDADQWEGRSDG